MKIHFYRRRSFCVVCFFITFLSLVAFNTLNATNYYFSSTSGDDSRTNLQAQNPTTPWASLTKLNSYFGSLNPGDSVLFKRGEEFYGSITINKSGTSSLPIILGAYGNGAKPVITGFTTINSWTSVGNGVYENVISSGLTTLNMVIVNGAFQPIGRWPKANAANSGYLSFQSHSATSSITSNAISGAPNCVGGQIVLRSNHYNINKGIINSQTSTSVGYTYIAGTHTLYEPDNGNGFFFQNHVNTCTALGDWAYEASSKKLKMYFGTYTPASYIVKASVVDVVVTASSKSYVIFDNISFQGSNSKTFNFSSSNNIKIINCDVSFAGMYGLYTDGSCNNISLDASTISYVNNNAIEASSSPNWKITSCAFNNIGNVAGLGVSGDGHYIGINSVGNNSLVELNTITNIGYVPVLIGGSGVIVRKNFINTFCSIKDDGGGIYTQNSGSLKTISNNIVLNGIGAPDGTSDAASSAIGIYIDDNGAYADISNNTVANCINSGLYLHNAHDIQVHDNNFYNNGTNQNGGQMVLTNDSYGGLISNIGVTKNIFFSKISDQAAMRCVSSNSTINSFGSWDNNYYLCPINDSYTIFNRESSPVWRTLAQWKTFSSNDGFSKKSPKTITTLNDLRFEYNATASNKAVNLGATYIGADSVIYSGSITLAPFTSKILIYLSGTVTNQPPVANAGPDKTFFFPTTTATTLSGSGTDSDGTIASYLWTKISGPSQFTIVSATQAQTVINNLVAGVYQFELKVTDNLGAIGRDTVIITLDVASNQPPAANAGSDKNITLPTNTVTLSGSGTDSDGTIGSYLWTKISGPSQYILVSPTQAQTVINNLIAGVYQFELKVTDNLGATGRDTIIVTVNAATNQSPVANAGPDKNITLPTNTVTLSGSGTDSDGTIASYQWTKISGPSQFTIVSPTQIQAIINNLVAGVYQFELKVTDNLGATGRDTVIVTVNATANQPPVANAGPDKNITLPTNTVTLSGSGTDSDGSIASYQWTKISGLSQFTIVSPNQVQTVINNLVAGVYQFELKVTDNLGAVGRDTVIITVNSASNQSPTANAGIDKNIILPTNIVTLTGSGNDPDGTIASYHWTKISGPSQFIIISLSLPQTAINNLVQGVYQFELKVTDNLGAVGRDTVLVTVNAAANQPPVANADLNKNITLPTNTVTLAGSGADADGTIVSYQWTKISGPSQFTIVSPTQAGTVINNMVQGIYQFELKVTDNLGAVGRDTVVVSVNAAVNQPPIANVGSDQNITLPTNTVTLSGSGTDADGYIASYRWTKISGPSQYSIQSPTKAQTVINSLVQGVYQFELKVTDNLGATGRDTVVVTVNYVPNQTPVANAGLSLNITLPTNTVTLTGSGNDADGTISSYGWRKISGPSQYSIVSANSAQTVIKNLVQGVYKFELKVTDNLNAVGRDTMTVTVNPAAPNQSPVANAGLDINITLPTNFTSLAGTGSDADGTIASYLWTKISGPSQFTVVSFNQPQTVINNLLQGVYKFELKVTDNQGAVGRDTIIVTVNAAPNQSPVADADRDLNITLPINTVTVNGSGDDADGTIASYLWTKISGPSQFTIASPTQAHTVINNLAEGVYQFELKVTDNLGATGSDTMTVTVNAAINQPPFANAGLDITITLPTNIATLIGDGSDADGIIASYLWTKISGPFQFTIASPTQAHTVINNLVEGVYQFELKVTDNLGAVGKDTMTVTVKAAVNQPPVANAGLDINITLPTNTATLFGDGNDADGIIASYLWTKISGPSQFNIVSPNQAQTAINNLIQGIYQFELKVTDNLGLAARDTVTVTVNATVNQLPVANAGLDINITLPTNNTTLVGSGTDADGTIVAYLWTKVSGPSQFTIVSPTQPQTIINNLVQGVYQFELKVTDNLGTAGKDTVTVTVNGAVNQPPVANAGLNINITLPTNNTTLIGSGTDSEGTINFYQWTKISGPAQYTIVSPTQPQTIINNLVQGIYLFELKVTDNLGAIGKDTVTVTVNAAVNQPPVANTGLSINITLPTNNTILIGSGTDVDGTIVSYLWTKISGPIEFNLVSPASNQTIVNNLVQGIYLFELKVTDNLGAVGKDTVTVTVNPASTNQPNISSPLAEAIAYPNPATESINIKITISSSDYTANSRIYTSGEKSTTIGIYNSMGRLVHQEELVMNQQTVIKNINIKNYPAGIYFIKIGSELNYKKSLKFIKQ